jgi:predicted enzyme related to lactoylglutathione lyase
MSEGFVDRFEARRRQREAEEQHGHGLPFSLLRPFYGIVPVFLVDDIDATCAYYEVVLGFDINFTHGNPPTFACVSRNAAVINLNKAEPAGARNSAVASGMASGSDAYVLVGHIDEVYEEMKRYGAKIVSELASCDYGMREFQVEDCNQYRLTLAEGMMQPDHPGGNDERNGPA